MVSPRDVLRDIIGNLLIPHVIKVLRKELVARREIQEWLDFACSFHRTGNPMLWSTGRIFSIVPSQIKEEIHEFLKILAERKPEFLMEIGTASGGTLFLFGRVASSKAVIISMDLPGSVFGSGYPNWRSLLYESFAASEQRIFLVRADSHNEATLNTAERILRGHKLDLLFIDGDHTYDGVKKDFEMYSHLVRKGGIIAFHDVNPSYYVKYGTKTESRPGDVYRFWSEIKNDYRHLEIIFGRDQDGFGIGVLYI